MSAAFAYTHRLQQHFHHRAGVQSIGLNSLSLQSRTLTYATKQPHVPYSVPFKWRCDS